MIKCFASFILFRREGDMALSKQILDVIHTFVQQKLQNLPLMEQSEDNVMREYVDFVVDEHATTSKSDEQADIHDVIDFKDGRMKISLSPLVGPFQPHLMEAMVNLQHIDISFCAIDPQVFIDTVVKCPKIEEVVITGCTQFTEYQIVAMCKGLPNLIHLDTLKCNGILSVSAYQIITNSQIIKALKVEPKMPQADKKNWSQLRLMFLSINFGPSIRRLVTSK